MQKTLTRKNKKLLYIRIKNSWQKGGKKITEPFTITTCYNFQYREGRLTNEIYMDFKKKDDIIKYGVKRVF